MRYDGFISYSHAADGQLAPALQRGLQRLAKPWYRRRSLEIFRDETGLSVDPDLWTAIVRALDDAEWFILLTSPGAAGSEWVNREIEHWKANRSVDRILPVVTDGNWVWDTESGDLSADSDAVPPALRGVFTDEPRHLDLRWAHREEHLDLRDSRFRNAAAEIAAPLHGRTKDEIEGEDVRQHRRTVRIAWSAAATLVMLTVIALIAGGVAVLNAHRAEQRRVLAESQRLSNYSQNEPAGSDLAFLLAAQGYRLNANPLTEAALFRSVAGAPTEISARIPVDGTVSAVAISQAADRMWLGTTEGTLAVHRISDGRELARTPDFFKHATVAMVRLGNDAVVVTDGISMVTVDANLNRSALRVSPAAAGSLAAEPSTGRIAAGAVDGTISVWGAGDLTPNRQFTGIPGAAAADFVGVSALAWTPGGGLLAAGQDGGLRLFDPAAPDRPVWEIQDTAGPGAWVSALTVLDDGTVVTGDTDGMIGVLDGATGASTGAQPEARRGGAVRGLAYTGDKPGNGSVAAVDDDGYLRFYDHLTGKPVLTPLRIADVATAVAWDPANPLRGIVGGQGGAALLDYGTDRLPAIAHKVDGWDNVVDVAMPASGDRLAVVRSDLSKQPPLSELVMTDPRHPDPNDPVVQIAAVVEQLAFTPDGSLLLAGTSDGTVAVWDGHSGKATLTDVAPGDVVSQLAVSPDGQTVATGSISTDAGTKADAPVRFWRFDGSTLVAAGQTDHPTFGYGLAFSPDGRYLVVGGVNEFSIEPLDGGASLTVPLKDDMTRSLTVSPDSKTVAVGLWSGPVRFFRLDTGEATLDELRQAERATAIAFRDNNILVTVSADGGFKLWDLVGLRSLSDQSLSSVDPGTTAGLPLTPTLGLGTDIAATASLFDGRLIRWSLNPTDWIREGCATHRHELNDAEKDRFSLRAAPTVCSS